MLAATMSAIVLFATTAASLAACGEGVAAERSEASRAAPNFDDPPRAPTAIGTDVERCLPIAFGLPRFIADNVHSSRGMLVEAVYFATATTGSAQLGQITNTGTITITHSGAAYAPTPSDKLVVKLGAEVHEFVVKDAQGNSLADSAVTWLASPHVLEYTHTLPERAEARIRVKFDGTRFDAGAKGWVKLGEQRYDVDLSAVGGTEGTRDFDGHETALQYDLKGNIRGEGCEVTVSERHAMKSAGSYSLRLLTTQRGTASQIDARLANVLKCGGATYELSNVEVRMESVDKGNRQQRGITAVSGVILRDRAPFAACSLRDGGVYADLGTRSLRLDDIASLVATRSAR